MDKISFKIKNFFSRVFTHKIKRIAEISDHFNSVTSLALLHDGRLASSSLDGTIKVFNLTNYECELTIRTDYVQYPFISVLPNGNIVACSNNGSIYIYSISKKSFWLVHKIPSAHGNNKDNAWICVVIPISNNRFASGGNDKKIKIWNSNELYNCISILEGSNSIVFSLLQLKGKELLVSASQDRNLRIWSLKTYQFTSVITNVECVDTGGMMEIKENRVLVGGEGKITVVNINKLIIEKKYEDPWLGGLFSGCYLHDNEYIFTNLSGTFFIYDEVKNKIMYKIEKQHLFYVPYIYRINDKMIASGSVDRTIKIWSI